MSTPPTIKIRNFWVGRGRLTPKQRSEIIAAHEEALRMAQAVLAEFENIWDQEEPNRHIKRQEAWLKNDNLRTYFGIRNLTPSQIKVVRQRVRYIVDRLQAGLYLVFIPKEAGLMAYPCKPRRNAYAWWPRRIYICQHWFKNSPKHRGAILIHEIAHQIGIFGQTHHGAKNKDQALRLAQTKPKKARKSPENYEHLYEMF